MPQNESTPQPATQGPTAPSPADPASSGSGSGEPAPRRAPLPGEPGFKAPLTASQVKRANQTVKGMVISVVLTLAVALPVIFLNPSSTENTYEGRVDVAEVAQQTITTEGFEAVSPSFPDDWYANHATWNTGAADGVPFWEIGVVQGEEHYAQVLQTEKANPSWISLATDASMPTGRSVDVDGRAWQERTHSSSDAPKTILTTKIGSYTYVVSGDQGQDDFLAQTAAVVQKSAPGA